MAKIQYTCRDCGRIYELRMRVVQSQRRCSFCAREITTEEIDRQDRLRAEARRFHPTESDAANQARWAAEREEDLSLAEEGEIYRKKEHLQLKASRAEANRNLAIALLCAFSLFLFCVCAGQVGKRFADNQKAEQPGTKQISIPGK